MLTRRLLVVAALIAPSVARAEQSDPLQSLKQGIEREIEARSGEHAYTYEELAEARSGYSPAILALEKRWTESPHKLAGPILHPLFGPGVFPFMPVTIVSARLVSRSGQAASVEVVLTIRGQSATNRYNLIWDGSRWLIDNVFYPETDMVSWWKEQIQLAR